MILSFSFNAYGDENSKAFDKYLKDKEKCSKKIANSCADVGEYYYSTEHNDTKSLMFYKKACKYKDAQSCFNVANAFYGRGARANKEKMMKYFEKACELDPKTEACSEVAYYYFWEAKSQKDYDKAIALYEKACAGKDPVGCLALGRIYENDVFVKHDFKKAFRAYTISCEGDVRGGCFYTARMYEVGKGVKQSYDKAKKFYKKSCETENIKGCKAFIRLYKDGK